MTWVEKPVNVTGGLQDQCGFRVKGSGKLLTAEDYVEIGSLHEDRKSTRLNSSHRL